MSGLDSRPAGFADSSNQLSVASWSWGKRWGCQMASEGNARMQNKMTSLVAVSIHDPRLWAQRALEFDVLQDSYFSAHGLRNGRPMALTDHFNGPGDLQPCRWSLASRPGAWALSQMTIYWTDLERSRSNSMIVCSG